MVAVVEINQLAQLEMPGKGRRLGGDAFLQVAIAADAVDVVVYQVESGSVEVIAKVRFGDCHADTVAEALSERPGANLHAGRLSVFGVSRGLRAPLAELLQVLQGQIITGEVQQ